MNEATDVAEIDFEPAGQSKGIARPWTRFWAKMLDLWLAASVVLALWYGLVYFAARTSILAPIVAAIFRGDQSSTTSSTTPNYLWNLVFLFLALVVDAMIQATFGTTLGLKVVGARLEKFDHTRLSFRDCFQRNMGVLIFGFWLGFLAFIPMIINYRKASRGELLDWDKTAQTRVFNYHGNGSRTTLAAILLLLVVSGHIALIASVLRR